MIRHVTVFLMTSLVVRFDGSFRALVTSDGTTRRMATAAATISCTSSTATKDVLWIGGRHLDVSECRTSGEAEFAGLILGLEGLLLAHKEQLAPFQTGDDSKVVYVQGDCKTAIQQMQGRSRSRKLAFLRDQAHVLVEKIPWTLQFEHIPREQNYLCDRICVGLLLSKQNHAIECVSDSLLDIIHAVDYSVNGKSLRQVYNDFWMASTTGLLPVWGLLEAYSLFITVAWLVKDYNLSKEASFELKRFVSGLKPQSVSTGEGDYTRPTRAEILDFQVQAIAFEIASLQKLGQDKEAVKLERREKIFFSRHGARNVLDSLAGSNDLSCNIHAIEQLAGRIQEWKSASLKPAEWLTAESYSTARTSADMTTQKWQSSLSTALNRLCHEAILPSPSLNREVWVSVK